VDQARRHLRPPSDVSVGDRLQGFTHGRRIQSAIGTNTGPGGMVEPCMWRNGSPAG
jgi:hypothetical protein